MEMKTVALMAAALVSGTALNAGMPIVGSNYSAVRVTSTDSATTRSQVSGVSVVAGPNGPEVVIAVDAAVAFNHFALEGPHRVVVDLAGAEVGLRARMYDGVARGPIKNVRLSQFRADTVRLVVDLDNAHSYKVTRSGGALRLVVDAPAAQFARWDMTGASAPKVAEAPAPKVAEAPATKVAEALQPKPADAPAAKLPEAAVVKAPAAVRKPESAGRLDEVTAPKKEVAKAPVMRDATQPVSVPIAEVPAPVPAAPAQAVVRRQQPQQKPRITVTYDGTDIRDVIATFASFSGRTIVVGKDVLGTVTADINDKPWDIALQAILSAQGLSATEDASGILTVDSYRNLASNQALEPLVTRILDVNYAKASTLQQTVQKLLARDCTGLSTMASGRDLGMNMQQQGSGQSGNQGGMQGSGCVVRGSVAADSATNKLIITEVPSRLPEIIARLQELDIRTPQVAIKAKIVFINQTNMQDIGLAYDLGTGTKQFFQQLVPRTDPSTLHGIDTNGDGVPDALGGGTPFQGPARIALGGKAISAIANAGNAIKANALNLIYSAALGKYQLTTFLNALTTSSMAEVQSEPSVTILNNRTATIFVGQEIPIRVIDASAGGSGQGGGSGGGGQSQPNAASFFPRATVSKEEAGIKLTVTPQITNNKMILLDLIAENSSAELANTDIGVVFNRQKAQSQVLVADGEAAVIGGLTIVEKSNFRSGIPFLMDLKWIGRLFSQNTHTTTKRELLILVTPHILDDGQVPPPGR
ncbi:MAG: AMIN domain-containing protein [Gemmatimonadota bacterium]|nr:AMIN domain-containing protein [Gemmatimonadota bacterium]